MWTHDLGATSSATRGVKNSSVKDEARFYRRLANSVNLRPYTAADKFEQAERLVLAALRLWEHKNRRLGRA
jgi:hypothetical protein